MKEPITKADITAAILLDDDTLVLFGAIDRALPAQGAVHLDGSVEGRYAGRSWADAEGERWFLGGIRVPGLAQMRPSRVELADENGERLVLPRLSNVRTNPAHLVSALKGFQPGALALALDFAMQLAASSKDGAKDGTDGESDRVGRLLSGLAQEVSQPDGFAEVFGRFRDGSLMFQGWARSFRTGVQKILIEAEATVAYRATAGSFARPDLPSDASGVLAVLTDRTPLPAAIRRIHYRAAEGWRHLEIFEHRTILPDGVASAHVRDMLGNLQDAEARQTMARIAASRYDGAETVSQLDIPVRTGLDMALRVPGAGLFVAGWLLDPTRQVRAVTLKGPGVAVRLDEGWSRLARRDVTDAFQNDGLFAGRLIPGQDRHGFTAFAAEPSGLPQGAEFHLELELAGDRFAFLPLNCLPPAPEALRRMLSLVNLDSPSIDTLIARHVGPMLRAARARSGVLPAAGVHPMGRPVKTPRISVILPVTDGREDVDLNIARLAIDPDFAETELLVVAAAGTHERLGGAVRQAATFYRMGVTFVVAPDAADPFEAMAAALPHARGERVLMLSPSVLPTEKGWLSALERVSRKSGGPVMVSPTLLYEDHSIRFAGIMAVEGPDGAKTFERRFAGYPRDWLKEQDAATVDAAAPECALLPKDALARALAAMGSYMGADHKGLDLCLRLRALGGACVWLPRVTLVALDEQPRDAHADRWRRAGAMVDRWSFEDIWSARAAA